MVILFMHATCLMIAMYHDDQNRAVGVVAYDDSPEVAKLRCRPTTLSCTAS
jgi:hypothetical protein